MNVRESESTLPLKMEDNVIAYARAHIFVESERLLVNSHLIISL